MRMEENEKNQKRLECLIEEAFDDMEIEEKIEEQKFEFSDEHNKKIKEILHREQTRRTIKRYNNYLKKGVAILIIAFMGIGVLTFSVEAYRVKFLNFIIEYTDRYTEIRYNENISKESDSKGNESEENNVKENNIENNEIELNYIPQNFVLKRKKINDTSIYMEFENSKESFILSAKEKVGIVHIDTENAEVENLNINDKQYMLVEKDGRISVHWTTDNMIYLLSGNIKKEEIINIIKNFK